MGCDIHAIFQRKTTEGYKDILTEYDEQRDYMLFGLLAGVRGMEFDPIVRPRGLPPDFSVDGSGFHPIDGIEYQPSFVVQFYDEHPGALGGEDVAKHMGDHSYTWYAGQELLDWWNAHKSTRQAVYLAYFFNEVKRLVDEWMEIRFVCGFDS